MSLSSLPPLRTRQNLRRVPRGRTVVRTSSRGDTHADDVHEARASLSCVLAGVILLQRTRLKRESPIG